MNKGHASLILAAAVLAPSLVWSQAAEVSGQVNTPDQKPAAGIPVIIKGPVGNTVVFTDQTGRWTLYEAPAGQYSAKPMVKPPDAPQITPAPASEVPFVVQKKNLFDSLLATSPKIEIEKSLVVPQKF
jgi:hypothetical protein